MAPRSIEIIIEGGTGSGHTGHLGVPGHHGGSLPKAAGMSDVQKGAPETEPSAGAAFMPERGEKLEYDMLRGALLNLESKVLPSGKWYRVLRDSAGNAAGYLLGQGRTVIARVPKAYGDDIDFDALFEADESRLGPDIQTSIQYQLSKLTDKQAARWCTIAQKEVVSAEQLADQWDVWSVAGLAQLLFVRVK